MTDKETQSDHFHQMLWEHDRANEYEKEILEDDAFENIKLMNLAWLNNEELPNISDNDLIIAYEFLLEKYNEIYALKALMFVPTYTRSFTDISHSMSHYRKDGSLGKISEEPIFNKLTKDINHTIDQLMFNFGIVKRIINERKIFKH